MKLNIEKGIFKSFDLIDISNALRIGLANNYKNVEVDVVECPNLRKWDCPSVGISGNQKIIDVGGEPYMHDKNYIGTEFDYQEISKRINSSKSYALGAGSGAMSCLEGHCGELIINENLILCSNPKIEQFVCNDTFETFKNTCTSYLHEDSDIYDDIYDLVEQIVDLELNNLDMPKRSLTMTLETIEDFNDETKDEIRNKLEILKNIPQPQQKSLDWYHFRYNLISASNLWKIFGTESQKNSLIYEKCKPLDLSRCEIQNYSSSGPMHWGVKYEPVTILIYEDMYKTKVEEFGCIQHPEYNFIGASPDGLNIDETNNKFGKMLEIKNIVNREITGIPKTEYWIQTQIQMETCDLNECDFVETRFKEIEKEDEFYNLSTKHDYKGVILHFIEKPLFQNNDACLLYTSDAADE